VTIASDNRSEPPLDKIAVHDGLVRLFENLTNFKIVYRKHMDAVLVARKP